MVLDDETFMGEARCKHGPMKLLQGISKKNGKPYYGYACTALPVNEPQCPPVWYRNIAGEWKHPAEVQAIYDKNRVERG